ncbi:hypothetical protein ACP275_07G107500 [Erythranthe tilingii]
MAGTANVPEVDRTLRARDEIIKELKIHLAAAQNQMKQAADKHRREEQFEIGDWVYLKLQPYRQRSVFKRVFHKLASRFYGPFRIVERIGRVAYKLDLPSESRVHPVFHVSLLRRKLGDQLSAVATLPPYTVDGEPVLEPTQILESRAVAGNGGRVREVLVKWNSLPVEDATWEALEVLVEKFPHLNLEDKVVFEEGGNDKPRRSMRTIRPNRRYLD